MPADATTAFVTVSAPLPVAVIEIAPVVAAPASRVVNTWAAVFAVVMVMSSVAVVVVMVPPPDAMSMVMSSAVSAVAPLVPGPVKFAVMVPKVFGSFPSPQLTLCPLKR